jgi:dihydrolipoamide dehydrogenase
VAFAEGFVVADAIAGLNPDPVDHHQAPRVTYCTPEVASVGLTEPEARAMIDGVKTMSVSLNGNARALIEGQGGRLKLVTDEAGTVLGVHIVGPGATELISEAALATSWGALAGEIGEVIHAHPTLAEGMREAALRAAGMPFHG